MRTLTTRIAILVAVALALFSVWSIRSPISAVTESSQNLNRTLITAPGRVEPVSEEVHVGSELSGKLKTVLVQEGSFIRAGEVMAVLENGTYIAHIQTARAELNKCKAEYRRVLNGARTQERLEARAAVEEADVVLVNTLVERDRRQALLADDAVSKEEVDRAEREWKVAVARKRAAEQRYALVDDVAREEDRARAAAAVELASSTIAEREAVLAKTYIRAPISGVVLRKHHNAGENVLNSPDDPILSLGDISRLRVRVEIDEIDIAGVRVGQLSYVTADAYGSQRFSGTVSRIGQALGKKKVWTDEPAERVDTKVLEVLIDLDPGVLLPTHLRVDAYIDIGKEEL